MKTAQKPLKSGDTRGRLPRLAFAASLVLLAACGRDSEPVPKAPPYTDPGFIEAGAWRMDYALTMTRDLPSAIAGSYGIEQRPNLALLTVTLAPTDTRAEPPAVSAAVEATAIALTGERTTLPLERHARRTSRPGSRASRCVIACPSRSRFGRARQPTRPSCVPA